MVIDSLANDSLDKRDDFKDCLMDNYSHRHTEKKAREAACKKLSILKRNLEALYDKQSIGKPLAYQQAEHFSSPRKTIQSL